MVDIVQKIADQIAHHRAEILRLESALQVIAEMGDKSAAKAAEKPMITIRKTIDHQAEEKPARRPRKKHKVTPTDIDAGVIAYLRANGPSRSADISKAVNCDPKRLWSRLWHLKKSGAISRDEANVYHLVQAGGADSGAGVEQAA